MVRLPRTYSLMIDSFCHPASQYREKQTDHWPLVSSKSAHWAKQTAGWLTGDDRAHYMFMGNITRIASHDL